AEGKAEGRTRLDCPRRPVPDRDLWSAPLGVTGRRRNAFVRAQGDCHGQCARRGSALKKPALRSEHGIFKNHRLDEERVREVASPLHRRRSNPRRSPYHAASASGRSRSDRRATKAARNQAFRQTLLLLVGGFGEITPERAGEPVRGSHATGTGKTDQVSRQAGAAGVAAGGGSRGM